MICYYYIKTADGGNIKIPAFTAIKNTPKLDTLIKEYYSLKGDKIKKYLKADLKLNSEEVNIILSKSNEDSFLKNLNEFLKQKYLEGNLNNLPETL
jgi:hypothetical protein